MIIPEKPNGYRLRNDMLDRVMYRMSPRVDTDLRDRMVKRVTNTVWRVRGPILENIMRMLEGKS